MCSFVRCLCCDNALRKYGEGGVEEGILDETRRPNQNVPKRRSVFRSIRFDVIQIDQWADCFVLAYRCIDWLVVLSVGSSATLSSQTIACIISNPIKVPPVRLILLFLFAANRCSIVSFFQTKSRLALFRWRTSMCDRRRRRNGAPNSIQRLAARLFRIVYCSFPKVLRAVAVGQQYDESKHSEHVNFT